MLLKEKKEATVKAVFSYVKNVKPYIEQLQTVRHIFIRKVNSLEYYGERIMCDKCKPEEHKRCWVHIADDWSLQEIGKMLEYLDYLRRVRE
jgi:vacuolar-type H+-ATPase subunit D/Vma8